MKNIDYSVGFLLRPVALGCLLFYTTINDIYFLVILAIGVLFHYFVKNKILNTLINVLGAFGITKAYYEVSSIRFSSIPWVVLIFSIMLLPVFFFVLQKVSIKK